MRKAEIRSQTFRLDGAQKAEDGPAVSLSLVWAKFSQFWGLLESRPALVFVLLSCAFGSVVSVIVPPLRGPDEIAHFLRIYSYTRGEFLPIAQAGDRKGILVGPFNFMANFRFLTTRGNASLRIENKAFDTAKS